MTEFRRAPKSNRFVDLEPPVAPSSSVVDAQYRRPPSPQGRVLDTFDVSQLPSVPLVDERMPHVAGTDWDSKGIHLPLPQDSTVYFVLSDTNEVLYVGQSIQTKQRWKFHLLLPELRSRLPMLIRIAYLRCPEDELRQREADFLVTFRPRLNTPWEMDKALHPDHEARPFVTREQAASLSTRDRIIATMELDHYPAPCSDHGESSMVICTVCLTEIWCAACLYWRCECWKQDRWTLPSIETQDALTLALDAWNEAHPGVSWWDVDRQCQALGGNKGQFVAFALGLHWPTVWEADILARSLGTTLAALEADRDAVLRSRKDNATIAACNIST